MIAAGPSVGMFPFVKEWDGTFAGAGFPVLIRPCGIFKKDVGIFTDLITCCIICLYKIFGRRAIFTPVVAGERRRQEHLWSPVSLWRVLNKLHLENNFCINIISAIKQGSIGGS